MIVQAKALLDSNKEPDEAQIREALKHNLCRCGAHLWIVRAIKRASGMMA
jgi:nicotinate dehydrogenase subunit A